MADSSVVITETKTLPFSFTLPVVGAAGVPSDTDGDTIDDRATWVLGDVLNTADGVNDAATEIQPH